MKLRYVCLALAWFALNGTGCSADGPQNSKIADAKEPKNDSTKNPDTNMLFFTVPPVPDGAEYITLGAGCFWCTEAIFQQLPGVLSVTSGYMGGTTVRPTYEQVCTETTGHAEVSRVVFDPKKTSLAKILEVFWEAHDPTSLNRQGNDEGTQYRSAIFYNNDAQRAVAEKSKADAAKEFKKPIVTEITQAGEFYPAENYHQNYYILNKAKNPYCSVVISPKLEKLGLKH